jgi:hypothetical protein
LTRSILHSMKATKHRRTMVQRRRQPESPSKNCRRAGGVGRAARLVWGGGCGCHRHPRGVCCPRHAGRRIAAEPSAAWLGGSWCGASARPPRTRMGRGEGHASLSAPPGTRALMQGASRTAVFTCDDLSYNSSPPPAGTAKVARATVLVRRCRAGSAGCCGPAGGCALLVVLAAAPPPCWLTHALGLQQPLDRPLQLGWAPGQGALCMWWSVGRIADHARRTRACNLHCHRPGLGARNGRASTSAQPDERSTPLKDAAGRTCAPGPPGCRCRGPEWRTSSAGKQPAAALALDSAGGPRAAALACTTTAGCQWRDLLRCGRLAWATDDTRRCTYTGKQAHTIVLWQGGDGLARGAENALLENLCLGTVWQSLGAHRNLQCGHRGGPR